MGVLGNGDGTFQAAVSYPAYGTSIFIADMNGDGKLDLITGGGSLLLGNGDGTFENAISTGINGACVAVADLNGDGIPDLVVESTPMLIILLGKGDGSFEIAQSYAVGGNAIYGSVAVADYNGDGHPDLAIGGATVTILLGNGDGSFNVLPVNYVVGQGPAYLVVGDFNGDGHPDLAAGSFNSSTVSILLAKGDGTFQPDQTFEAGPRTSRLVVADLNRDGILDLAVANFGGGTLAIFLGNGDGTFGPAQNFEVSSQSPGSKVSIALGDFNGDGIPDLVVVDPAIHPYEGTVNIFLGNGDGTLQPPVTFSAGFGPLSVAVGDFNGDGKQDLVTANLSYAIGRVTTDIWEDDVRVFLGNGDGTFQPGQAFVENGNPVAVAVGDFNGDGIPDLALADQLLPTGVGYTATILLGKGDGSFVNPQHFVVGGNPVSLAVGDFNSDGHLDLAVADYVNPGAVTILLNAEPGRGNSSRPPE